MGDWAEDEFRKWATANEIRFEEWGLKRPDFKRFARMPKLVRHQPDFICEVPKHMPYESHFFTEVKGVGKDQVIKVKAEDLECVEQTQYFYELPVYIFVYDSHNKQTAIFESQKLIDDDKSELVHGVFQDGNKPYFGIPTSHRWLTWEPLASS